MIHYRKPKSKKTVCGVNLILTPIKIETRTSWPALLKSGEPICERCFAWSERKEKKKAIMGVKRSLKTLEKDTTALWRKAVWLDWGGKCALCGKATNDHNAHHYFTKGVHAALRYEPHCGILMDYGCHIGKVHRGGEIEDARDLLVNKIGNELFERLKQKSHDIQKWDEDALLLAKHYLIEYIGDRSV